MKSLILLVQAAVGVQAAESQSLGNSTIIEGVIGTENILSPTAFIVHPAIADTIQIHDVTFQGGRWANITGVHAAEMGVTQHATARVLTGGFSRNHVTIRLQSTRGGGLFYQWTVWGNDL